MYFSTKIRAEDNLKRNLKLASIFQISTIIIYYRYEYNHNLILISFSGYNVFRSMHFTQHFQHL